MCLLFYDSRSDADLTDFPFKLVLANTRDEFYDRPTKDAFLWQPNETRKFPVIAGKHPSSVQNVFLPFIF